MSYYRQAGVESGLVRKINEGMSSRVKTGDEFANTRLNNEEFTTAATLVKPAYDAVWPKWRTMMRRFAFSDMVKLILENLKRDNAEWGKRIPVTSLGELYPIALEDRAKGGQYDGHYGTISAAVTAPEIEFTFELTAEQAAQLQAEGVDGVQYAVAAFAVGVSHSPSGTQRVPVFFVRQRSTITRGELDTDSAGEETASIIVTSRDFLPGPELDDLDGMDNNGVVFVVGIMPTRTVGGQSYILQEKCTYAVFGYTAGQFLVP